MSNTLITILGCGSSSGVPTIENGWGNANSNNSKNFRNRSSILVNIDGFCILIDTSPELRLQALKYKINCVDVILYTHEHSDHIVGIDDIRSFNRLKNKPINCYLNQKTYNRINTLFDYSLRDPSEFLHKNYYRPALIPNIIKHMDTLYFNNNKIMVKAIEHNHGLTNAMGFKFNNKFAYITDILDFLNEDALNEYKNLEVIIMSACVIKPHKSHMTFDKVIDILTNKLKPKRAFLTHMSEEIDFDTQTLRLRNKNINNIFLSYDGLQIKL